MTTLAASVRPSPLAVFRNRSFTALWVGQFVSAMGSSFTTLASSILVYRLTGSALSVGLMLMATALPSFVVGLVAGVFVDRFDRKRIMIVSDLLRAALVLLIPLLVPSGIGWLYALTILSATVTQFFDPAHASLLPELATDEELAAANSMMAISSLGSTAVGFAASGLLASRLPIQWAFVFDSFTFLFSVACLLSVRASSPAAQGDTNVQTVVNNLRSGLSLVAETPILRSLFLVYLPVFLTIGLVNSLLLPFAVKALHATEFDYGLLAGAEAVGYVFGSLALSRYFDRMREGIWLALSLIGMGIEAILFSQSATVLAGMVLILISGTLNMPSVVARQIIIQRSTTRDMRGRVFSSFFVMRNVVFTAGMAAAGLADVLNIRDLYLAAGTVIGLAGLAAMLAPGLGQTTAEWRRALGLLRAARFAPGPAAGRAFTLADFDLLAAHLPALYVLSAEDRAELLARAKVNEVPTGAVILRRGDASDNAYFVIDGRVIAGWDEEGGYRPLEVLNAGDFFGEIAALTGSPRTANVVAERDSSLLAVPASSLRQLMMHAELNRLFLSKLTERLARMNLIDVPLLGATDQRLLADLRRESGSIAASSAASDHPGGPNLPAAPLSPRAG